MILKSRDLRLQEVQFGLLCNSSVPHELEVLHLPGRKTLLVVAASSSQSVDVSAQLLQLFPVAASVLLLLGDVRDDRLEVVLLAEQLGIEVVLHLFQLSVQTLNFLQSLFVEPGHRLEGFRF